MNLDQIVLKQGIFEREVDVADYTGRQLPFFRRATSFLTAAKFYACCLECSTVVQVISPQAGDWWVDNHSCNGVWRVSETGHVSMKLP